MVVIHRDAEGELEIAVTGPVLVDSADEEAASARAARDLPRTRAGEAGCAQCRRSSSPTSTRPCTRPIPTAPLRGRQHVDPRAGRRSAAGPAPDRRDAARCAFAHALDELGPEPGAPRHGLQRRGRDLHRPLRRLAGRRRRRANVAWVADRMREMEHLSSGIQLADENLGERPARFVSDENLARLDEIRAAL